MGFVRCGDYGIADGMGNVRYSFLHKNVKWRSKTTLEPRKGNFIVMTSCLSWKISVCNQILFLFSESQTSIFALLSWLSARASFIIFLGCMEQSYVLTCLIVKTQTKIDREKMKTIFPVKMLTKYFDPYRSCYQTSMVTFIFRRWIYGRWHCEVEVPICIYRNFSKKEIICQNRK